jgi:hypothetical protein
MKVIIDLIENIRESIQNSESHTVSGKYALFIMA